MWTMRCSKSDIKLFRSCFLFFLSLVNKYCLTHSFWWFLGSKKKKKAYVSVLTTYSGRCLLFFHNNLPQTSNCLGDCKLSKDNLSRLVLQHSPLILILKNVFSTPTRNPESSGALLENFQPDLFHLHTDPLYWLYENVLLFSSENWRWIKQYSLSKEHFFYRPFLLITFQF